MIQTTAGQGPEGPTTEQGRDAPKATQLAQCLAWSQVFRRNLNAYDLKPHESWLAHQLCIDSFDLGLTRAPVQKELWAQLGGFHDGKGLRCDKLEKVLLSLQELGVVDIHQADGTYELRPAAADWSRLRAFRHQRPGPLPGQPELRLCAERPLSEALSDLSRERALAGAGVVTSDSSALFSRLRRAVKDPSELATLQEDLARMKGGGGSGPPAGDGSGNLAAVGEITRRSAEKSADTKSADLQGFAASAEKSAERTAAADLAVPALSTKAGSAKGQSAEKSAETAMAWLRAKDSKGRLEDPAIYAQWAELCERNPRYVLDRLRWRLQFYQERNAKNNEPPIEDPLAWMSRKARDDRQMRPLARRGGVR